MAQLELPTYTAKHSEDFPSFLVVFCPRDDCASYPERPFLVHKRSWLRPIRRTSRTSGQPYKITGRSCPYCFRAARIPPIVEIG